MLSIESMNSPDALRAQTYNELMDALGITYSNDWGWLRIIKADDIEKLKIT